MNYDEFLIAIPEAPASKKSDPPITLEIIAKEISEKFNEDGKDVHITYKISDLDQNIDANILIEKLKHKGYGAYLGGGNSLVILNY